MMKQMRHQPHADAPVPTPEEQRRRRLRNFWIFLAIACLLVAPAEVLFLLGDRTPLWTTGFALTSLFTLLHQAPVFAAAMSVARVNMRAVAISILVLFASLLGQVIGPVLVGVLNDQLQPVVGDTAIRYSLLVIAASALAAGVSFWAAIRFLEADARR